MQIDKLSAQEVIQRSFFPEEEEYQEKQDTNETLQLMEFVREHAIPLTPSQVEAHLLLKENGLEDIFMHVDEHRRRMTPFKAFMTLIGKLTLADRIKGNAKLSAILKANANPANAAQIQYTPDKSMSKAPTGAGKVVK